MALILIWDIADTQERVSRCCATFAARRTVKTVEAGV